MTNQLPDYTDKVTAAVVSYWDVRTSQAQRSVESGAVNTGLRAEVTGGRHLDALELLLIDVLVDAGIPARMMEVKRRPVPGYFRRDKSWDVVVTVEGRVLVIIELKSIVGSNPGQNFNNRTDEALCQRARRLDRCGARHHRLTTSSLARILHVDRGQRGVEPCFSSTSSCLAVGPCLRRQQRGRSRGDLL